MAFTKYFDADAGAQVKIDYTATRGGDELFIEIVAATDNAGAKVKLTKTEKARAMAMLHRTHEDDPAEGTDMRC